MIKRIKRAPKEKKEKLYNDVGVCTRFTSSGKMINKSKYRTEEDAKKTRDKLINIGVMNPLTEIYKCPECKMWHPGTKEDQIL